MIRISEAELEVMKVIWEKKEATSLEIIEELKSFNWKFNTIRTMIKRLQNKGAIEIAKKEGKTYTYRAAIDEVKYKTEATKDLIKKLYNNSVTDFVYEYCIDNHVSPDEIKKLIIEIDEKEKLKEKNKNKK